jgi:hypothetical protein
MAPTKSVKRTIFVQISTGRSVRQVEAEAIQPPIVPNLNLDDVDAFWDFDFLRGMSTWEGQSKKSVSEGGSVFTKAVLSTSRSPARSAGCLVAILEIYNSTIKETTNSRVDHGGCCHCITEMSVFPCFESSTRNEELTFSVCSLLLQHDCPVPALQIIVLRLLVSIGHE